MRFSETVTLLRFVVTFCSTSIIYFFINKTSYCLLYCLFPMIFMFFWCINDKYSRFVLLMSSRQPQARYHAMCKVLLFSCQYFDVSPWKLCMKWENGREKLCRGHSSITLSSILQGFTAIQGVNWTFWDWWSRREQWASSNR